MSPQPPRHRTLLHLLFQGLCQFWILDVSWLSKSSRSRRRRLAQGASADSSSCGGTCRSLTNFDGTLSSDGNRATAVDSAENWAERRISGSKTYRIPRDHNKSIHPVLFSIRLFSYVIQSPQPNIDTTGRFSKGQRAFRNTRSEVVPRRVSRKPSGPLVVITIRSVDRSAAVTTSPERVYSSQLSRMAGPCCRRQSGHKTGNDGITTNTQRSAENSKGRSN
jgi:hypothetical protein